MNTCGARTKSTSKPCRRLPCKNGRCKLHGGRSTGPRTAEGRQRCAEAKWKHGLKSKKAIEERRLLKQLMQQYDEFLKEITQLGLILSALYVF